MQFRALSIGGVEARAVGGPIARGRERGSSAHGGVPTREKALAVPTRAGVLAKKYSIVARRKK